MLKVIDAESTIVFFLEGGGGGRSVCTTTYKYKEVEELQGNHYVEMEDNLT